MSEQSKAVDGAKEPSQNMSFEELVARRTEARTEVEEEIPELEIQQDDLEIEDLETDLEIEQVDPEIDDLEIDPEAEESGEIDLLSLTPEQIQQLAKKGKSRLLQRIGELTAKNKALEESARAETKPLPKPIPAAENPFSHLKTVEEIEAKYAELEKVAEETDRVLEDHEDYGADDVITLAGKEFTKKEIRTANRNSRNAMLKFLPAQHAEIARSSQRTAMETEYNAAIPLEIPEMADENSEMAKQFSAMNADPLIDQVRQLVPELAPQLGYLLAHAIRSLHSKKTPVKARPTATGIPVRPKVAPAPFGAAGPSSSRVPVKKVAEKAYEQFEKSGSTESWIAARIARNL